MASAYATLASGGVRHRSTAIERVEFPPDQGREREIDTFEDSEGRRVLSDGVAYETTEILKTVIARGTATGARIGCPAAGKTGTTDDQTGAWFVGYTPRLSAAVWTGYPDARTSMGPDAFGGTYAAPIWRDFVTRARRDFCGDFPEPEDPVELSSFSSDLTVGDEGKVPTDIREDPAAPR